MCRCTQHTLCKLCFIKQHGYRRVAHRSWYPRCLRLNLALDNRSISSAGSYSSPLFTRGDTVFVERNVEEEERQFAEWKRTQEEERQARHAAWLKTLPANYWEKKKEEEDRYWQHFESNLLS